MGRERYDPHDLKAAISRRLEEMLVPGAVVLWHTPDFLFEEAFGRRTALAEQGDPILLTDHFRVGSNTKTMTGTIVLQLIADPDVDLGLDDPVSMHYAVPGTTKLDRITIRHLLEMKSGLSNYSDSLSFNKRLDDPKAAFEIDDLIVEGVMGASAGAPGGRFHYSNTNTAILGKIIERLDRRDLSESFHDRIIGPLNLSSTYLPHAEDTAMPRSYAHGYMFGTNVSTIETMALPPADRERARRGELAPYEYTHLTPSWTWAAGGLISTAGDLATYVRALVRADGGLLPPELHRQRLDSVKSTDPADRMAAGYGLALAQFGPMLGHDGTLPGYQSFMGHDPEQDETLIVATNLSAAPDGKLTANEIAILILQ
jgi:D-alanyl-D-alanine carboxypeptidase